MWGIHPRVKIISYGIAIIDPISDPTKVCDVYPSIGLIGDALEAIRVRIDEEKRVGIVNLSINQPSGDNRVLLANHTVERRWWRWRPQPPPILAPSSFSLLPATSMRTRAHMRMKRTVAYRWHHGGGRS